MYIYSPSTADYSWLPDAGQLVVVVKEEGSEIAYPISQPHTVGRHIQHRPLCNRRDVVYPHSSKHRHHVLPYPPPARYGQTAVACALPRCIQIALRRLPRETYCLYSTSLCCYRLSPRDAIAAEDCTQSTLHSPFCTPCSFFSSASTSGLLPGCAIGSRLTAPSLLK